MAEKMKVAEQAKYRAELYGAASEAFQSKGYTTETISDGMLVHLGEGQYSKVKISICDPAKFDLDHEREVYAQKMADAAGMLCWTDDGNIRYFSQILFHE